MDQYRYNFILENTFTVFATNIINNCLNNNPASVIFYLFYIIIVGLCGWLYYSKYKDHDKTSNAIDYNYYLANKVFLFMITFNFFYCYYPVTFIKNNFFSNNNLLLLVFNGIFFSGSIILFRYSSMKMPDESLSKLFILIFCGLLLSIFCIFFIYFTLGSNFLLFSFVTSNIDKCDRPTNQSFKCKMYKNGVEVSGVNT